MHWNGWKQHFLGKMANFLSFLENATSGGIKHCVDLNSASTYSSCNILHHKMPYNKISIVMDLFDLYGIPKVFKNPSILRKLDPFQLRLLQGILVYLYELQLCENHIFFSKLRALLVRRSTDILCAKWMLQTVIQLGLRTHYCYFPVKLGWPTYAFKITTLVQKTGTKWMSRMFTIIFVLVVYYLISSYLGRALLDFILNELSSLVFALVLWIGDFPLISFFLGISAHCPTKRVSGLAGENRYW